MRAHHRLAVVVTLLAGSAVACGGPAGDEDSTSSALFSKGPVGGPVHIPPVILPPGPVDPPPPPIYIGNDYDRATILADADAWFSHWFGGTDAQEGEWIRTNWEQHPRNTADYWNLGRRTSALLMMYDYMKPIDATRANTYLSRVDAIAAAILDERDDHRQFLTDYGISPLEPYTGHPIDTFRGHVMRAWGSVTADRDQKWNVDVVTSGTLLYALSGFARRVADDTSLQPTYGADAIRFTSAALETYADFRPELHLDESDSQAYFIVPPAYASLTCAPDATKDACEGYRDTAGAPLAWNENFAMMNAIADVVLAADSPMFRAVATPDALQTATYELPLVVVKDVRFFDDNLQLVQADDDIVCYQWNHQKPTARVQDTGHGGFELGNYIALYERKARIDLRQLNNGRRELLDITPDRLTLFANTLMHRIVKYDSAHSYRVLLDLSVDGSKDYGFTANANSACTGFTGLARVNQTVWSTCRDVTFTDPDQFLREDNHAALIRYRGIW